MGSFLPFSCESQFILVLVRGLPDTVEGSVLDSDVTLEPDRDATGLSSHVSHGSLETTESRFTEGDLACFDSVAFLVGAGLDSWFEVQNVGSAKSGSAPDDVLRTGDTFGRSVEALLTTDELLDDGRKLPLLFCFLGFPNACVELFLLGGGIGTESSPTVAWRKSSQNVQRPSLKLVASSLPVRSNAS